MNQAVADASFVFALRADRGPSGEAASRRAGAALHAPELLRDEVADALREVLLHGATDDEVGVSALETLSAPTIVQWDFRPSAARIWRLRWTLSAHDACCVAFAEHLQVPLLTFDRRPAGAPGVDCEVIAPA